jgi:tripartite-type tricarboxylate transporter receptor subunit TctC
MLPFVRRILPRRAAVPLLLAFAELAKAAPVVAQTWPKRPVTMVIPYAPGGSTDLVARLIAPGLGAALARRA